VLAIAAEYRGDKALAKRYSDYLKRVGMDQGTMALLDLIHMGTQTPEQFKARLPEIEARYRANPEDAAALTELFKAYAFNKKFDDIEKILDGIRIETIRDTARLDAIISGATAVDRMDDVLKALRRWAELEPNNWAVLTDAAFVAVSLKDPGHEAAGWIERAMAISPGSSEPWAARGELLRLGGQTAGALRAYQEAVRRTDASDPKLAHYQLMIQKLSQ
jgi:tetratricopeptide (TPR) repeat protein